MKKLFALVMVLVMTLTCFAACNTNAGAGTDMENIQQKGKIVIGITDYAPMDYKDENGNWTGFDAEFAQLFAKESPTGPRSLWNWKPIRSTQSGTV